MTQSGAWAPCSACNWPENVDVLQEIAITEGPPILAASMSLDGGLITLQRSSVRLEFVSCKTQNIFVQVTSFAVTVEALLIVSFVVSIQGCVSGLVQGL